MKRIKLLLTRLYHNFLYGHKYICPKCGEAWSSSWSYSPGYCGRCGYRLVKEDNRFNLCSQCGEPKSGYFCRTCGHAFMRI